MRVERVLGSAALRQTRWSIDVRNAMSAASLIEHQSHRLLSTASVAKIFLLVELAVRLEARVLDPHEPLDRRSIPRVADSGLWQHLSSDVLPVIDVAAFVGAVSDNLATNALIGLVGLDAVRARARSLAPDGSTLHDIVRDVRGVGVPPRLSIGSASDWAQLFVALRGGALVSPFVSAIVLDWLAPGVDLSMVASAFGLDPLAHEGFADRGIGLWNKTGTDAGVRADVGLAEIGGEAIAFAVLCNWRPGAAPDPRDAVLAAMRQIGEAIRSGSC
jgi:beta-lactamase class A